MKLKKYSVVLSLLMLAGLFASAAGAEEKEYEISLLVVPREEASVQVAFDLGFKGYPVMLLAWQEGPAGKPPVLHAWDGSFWVYVSPEDYKAGRFFDRAPDRALLVGSGGEDVAAALIPSSSWCSEIVHTGRSDLKDLLNFVGTQFDFPWPHWQWFAQRYGFQIDEINPEYLNDRWYYHRLTDYVARRFGRKPEPVPMEREIQMPADAMDEDFMIEVEDVPVIPAKQVEVIEAPPAEMDNPIEADEIKPAEVIEAAPAE